MPLLYQPWLHHLIRYVCGHPRALQEALFGAEHGDPDAFASGMVEYVPPDGSGLPNG
jgi:hypothetical protein